MSEWAPKSHFWGLPNFVWKEKSPSEFRHVWLIIKGWRGSDDRLDDGAAGTVWNQENPFRDDSDDDFGGNDDYHYQDDSDLEDHDDNEG